MKIKKIILYGSLLVLLLVIAATWYIIKEYNRTLKDTAQLKPDFSLQASALVKEFESNEKEAGKKYWDKVVRVNGLVKDIIRDEAGYYSVILGDAVSLSSVRCSMDSVHNNEANRLQKGSSATVKGICAGFNADEMLGSDVILVRCVVEE